MDKKLPIYKCEIDENLDNETGIFAMSFVDFPAVEVDFIALNKQNKKNTTIEHKLHLNEDKQILTGVVLIPNQLIYRYNQTTDEEYYITHSVDSIEKISHKMMRNTIVLHNTTHQHQSELADNYLVEMWIIQDPSNDKSSALGFKNLPKGTLMCSYKISDKKYWNEQVKTGNVKGFSLEGYFYQEELSIDKKKILSIDKDLKNNKINKTNKMNKNTSFLAKIRKVLQTIDEVESVDNTDSGENFREFTLGDGSIVKVDEEGFATIDGEQAPAGEHKLSDDNIIVIDADGYLVETSDEGDVEDPATPEVELDEDTPSDKFEVDIDGTKYEVDEVVVKYINDLLAEIASLKDSVAEDAVELKKLRKNTPSTKPINVKQKTNKMDYTKLSRAEKIAMQLSAFQNK